MYQVVYTALQIKGVRDWVELMDRCRWDKRQKGTRTYHFVSVGHTIHSIPQRRREGPISQQDHLRTKFYKHYQKEAAEYDREFMKKYDDDLNTTLIFVRPAHRQNARSLTQTTGWSVFCCDFRIHRLGPSGTQARHE